MSLPGLLYLWINDNYHYLIWTLIFHEIIFLNLLLEMLFRMEYMNLFNRQRIRGEAIWGGRNHLAAKGEKFHQFIQIPTHSALFEYHR